MNSCMSKMNDLSGNGGFNRVCLERALPDIATLKNGNKMAILSRCAIIFEAAV